MRRSRTASSLVTVAASLGVTAVLVGCGTGSGQAAGPVPYVAEFALGGDTREEKEFVLTPSPLPHAELLPAPSWDPPTVPPTTDEQPLPESPTVVPDTSPAPDPVMPVGSPLAWVNDGQYLGVVTWGSGSCPSGPYAIEVVADQEIEIRLGPLFPGRDPCSADMSPHVTVVELPPGVTPTKPLVARLADREVTIEAVGR